MNKILNVNLGGYALTIDDDAYEYMSAYLDNIRRRFSESEGRDEILRDIETRLGELITNDLGKRSIVMLPDVEAAVNIMGKPEDFGGEEPTSKTRTTGGGGSAAAATFRTGKRLYRDEEDAVVGGVCSGLAAYFGMPQSLWMRVIFVLLALISAGFWIPVYLVLWIVVAPARSSSERLAMRGETINVENIAKEFEQGVDRMGKSINSAANSLKTAGRPIAPMAANASSGCLGVLGKLMLGLLIMIAVSIVLALGTAWVAGIWAYIVAMPYISYFSPLSDGWTFVGFLCIAMVVGLPVIGLVLWLSRMIFNYKQPSWLGGTMGAIWIVSFIGAILLAAFGASSYRQSASTSEIIDLGNINSDTLRVEWLDYNSDDHYDENFDNDFIRMRDNQVKIHSGLEIKLGKAGSNRFEAVKIMTAHGRDHLNATDNARQTTYQAEVSGNILYLPTQLAIEDGKKWQANRVKVNIRIPIGKYVVFGRHINNYVRNMIDFDQDNDYDYHIYDYPNKVFKMTERGLVCVDCPSVGDSGFHHERNYDNYTLEGDFDTEIQYTDNEFSIQVEGDKDAIRINRAGDDLTLSTTRTPSRRTKVTIRTPNFSKLYADNTGEVTIRSFDMTRASVTARGSSKIKMRIDCNDLELQLSGPATAELIGDGDDLHATLTKGAVLNAESWKVARVEISAKELSKGTVYARYNATIRSDEGSTVKVEGNAEVTREQ